jgi:hypothetical protein
MSNDPRIGDFVWSASDEEFSNHDFDGLLEQLNYDGELEVGRLVFYGTRLAKPASYFMPGADFILDQAGDSAYDFGSEWAEDFGRDVTKEAKQELETFLAEWANKHLRVDFYQIEDVQQYVLTKEDVCGVMEPSA